MICCKLKKFVAESRRSFLILFATKLLDAACILLPRTNLPRSKMTSRAITLSCYSMKSLDSLNCDNLILLRDKFVLGWKNAQHLYSNCFAGMLRDEFGYFVARLGFIIVTRDTTVLEVFSSSSVPQNSGINQKTLC